MSILWRPYCTDLEFKARSGYPTFTPGWLQGLKGKEVAIASHPLPLPGSVRNGGKYSNLHRSYQFVI